MDHKQEKADLSMPMMVDFMRSHVGQMMSHVASEPHQEKTGNGSCLPTLLRGQSPRFTTSSMSGIRTYGMMS